MFRLLTLSPGARVGVGTLLTQTTRVLGRKMGDGGIRINLISSLGVRNKNVIHAKCLNK